MGFLDRLLGRPAPRPAADSSTTTIAAVNRSYANPGYRKYFTDRDPRRKAIATTSRWQSTYGIQRPNYNPAEIDRLAENVIYAMCEKRCMDYASTAEWTVEDDEARPVDQAIRFLERPNPQDTFSSLLVSTIPDIMRGDCGCWVKTFNGLNYLAELRAYNGDEFWPEVDRGFSPVEGLKGEMTYGVYSHGYVIRWWQHSAPGIFVPYDPAEIVYIRMYPRSDSPFGTSLLQRVKWQLEYLIDSTAAAGMTFANGVMPGLEWNHANLQGPEQLAEMIVDREDRYVGVQNAGGIIDTFEGDTLKPLTPSMVDMQWLDGQKLVSETIWAYFGFPASEFTMGDTNRATAYIARNIVKSSVLAPMLSRLEEYINGCVLPDLEGYQPDWTFKFIESVDKDDELKDVQVLQGRQQIAMGYYQMGMPLLMCLRLAGLPEEDIEAVKQEEIDAPDIDSDLPGSTLPQTDDGPVTEQYTGTDATQAHQGSDEGGGGPGGPRTSSATVCPSCGHEWYSKQSGPEITCPKCGNDMPRTTIRKASKEYVSSSHPAPEGAAVHEGPRGGEFYYAGKDGKPAEAPKGNGEAPADKPKEVRAGAIPEYEATLRGLPHERGACFDADGKIVVEKDGKGGMIEFTPEERARMKGRTFTHNHPHIGSFSKPDIRFAIENGLSGIRAIDPRYTYTMTPGENGWPHPEAVLVMYSHAHSDALLALVPAVRSGELTYEDAHRLSFHLAWKEVAESGIGIVYRREES